MTYYIILNSELNLVDFTELVENNQSTVRKSNDGNKVVLGWDDEIYPDEPEFIGQLSYYEGPFRDGTIYGIVNGPEWVKDY